MSVLDNILPEYEKISEAKGDDPNKRYKAILGTAGKERVYLITNPETWETRDNGNGTYTRIRPAPIFKGLLTDYIKPTNDKRRKY
jgi:hypothetical protein